MRLSSLYRKQENIENILLCEWNIIIVLYCSLKVLQYGSLEHLMSANMFVPLQCFFWKWSMYWDTVRCEAYGLLANWHSTEEIRPEAAHGSYWELRSQYLRGYSRQNLLPICKIFNHNYAGGSTTGLIRQTDYLYCCHWCFTISYVALCGKNTKNYNTHSI